MIRHYDFTKFFNSEELLANALLTQYKKEFGKLTYPIDPFKLLKVLGVKIVLKNFESLEGIYLPRSSENDVDLVAINFHRPIYRQRFTAAHEICHCIKDKNLSFFCPIDGRKNKIERFADHFAASLLMPKEELIKQVDNYSKKDGLVNLNDVIFISEYFGVSFESCVYRIAYDLNRLKEDREKKDLKKLIKGFKPDKIRESFGIKNKLLLTRQLIDSYTFNFPQTSASTIKFKQYLILNENRLEGINIQPSKLNYILADIRLNKIYSNYSSEKDKNVLEALGNIDMIEFVLSTDEDISLWKIDKLQKILFKYTPHGAEMLFPRQSNNVIKDSKISTVDYQLIYNEMIDLETKLQYLVKNKDKLSNSEYILEVLKIHHKLTVIHPLEDGNGRCSRAIILWLFKLKNIPPIYIKLEDKNTYLSCLGEIDKNGNYDNFEYFILQQILNSSVLLNENLTL